MKTEVELKQMVFQALEHIEMATSIYYDLANDLEECFNTEFGIHNGSEFLLLVERLDKCHKTFKKAPVYIARCREEKEKDNGKYYVQNRRRKESKDHVGVRSDSNRDDNRSE